MLSLAEAVQILPQGRSAGIPEKFGDLTMLALHATVVGK